VKKNSEGTNFSHQSFTFLSRQYPVKEIWTLFLHLFMSSVPPPPTLFLLDVCGCACVYTITLYITSLSQSPCFIRRPSPSSSRKIRMIYYYRAAQGSGKSLPSALKNRTGRANQLDFGETENLFHLVQLHPVELL